MELPVPMRNASGVLLDGALYIGGGYTGDSKTDVIIYVYHFAEAKWSSLPPSPMKWSTLTVLGGKLVLAGGRLARLRGSFKGPTYTNKVVAWDKEKEEWEDLPLMTLPRLSPFLIPHGSNCIIAAGGKLGMLDFRAEVYSKELGKWVRGPDLPHPCFSNTTAVVGDKWYLASTEDTAATPGDNVVHYVNIPDYSAVAIQELDKLEESAFLESLPHVSEASQLWRKLATSPPELPFRIASANSQLMALCNAKKMQADITVYLYHQEVWTKVVTSELPPTISSGGLLLDAEENENTIYLLGGESGQQSISKHTSNRPVYNFSS